MGGRDRGERRTNIGQHEGSWMKSGRGKWAARRRGSVIEVMSLRASGAGKLIDQLYLQLRCNGGTWKTAEL